MLPRLLSLFLLLAPEVSPQSYSPELPPGVLLLSRIKARVKRQFLHMPEYTCLETLDRFHKPSGRKAVEKQLDTVRIEVLFAGNREFYDSPGGHDFKESDAAKFISSGMIGDGMFAGHLKNIFVDDHGLFEYRGEEDLDGRRAARFDFRVPSLQSAYVVAVSGARANVSMVGKFWANPVTYDLVRIKIDAAEIPPILQTTRIVTTVDYAPTRIGADETLLAQTGDLLMVRESGEVAYDRFDFTHCRAYHADSTISFDDPGPGAPAGAASGVGAKPQPAAQAIPAGLNVVIALTVPLTDDAAVGDPVEGKIVGSVAGRGGAAIVQDGALVHGRVRQLEKSSDFGGYFSIGLEFTDIDAGGMPLRFFAELQSADSISGLEWNLATRGASAATPGKQSPIGLLFPNSLPSDSEAERQTAEHIRPPDLPGVGSFFMRGAHFEIPAAFRMIWKTRAM
jgi:hypothetical protein